MRVVYVGCGLRVVGGVWGLWLLMVSVSCGLFRWTLGCTAWGGVFQALLLGLGFAARSVVLCVVAGFLGLVVFRFCLWVFRALDSGFLAGTTSAVVLGFWGFGVVCWLVLFWVGLV